MTNAKRLFRHTLRHSNPSRHTLWGPFQAFDGHHLAAFALEDSSLGITLLNPCLDLIEQSLLRERSGLGDKWHLGDFALHTVLRALHTFPRLLPAALRERIRKTAIQYEYHDGGMSENHDLLHHAMRHLAGEAFPREPFCDGRSGAIHAGEATGRILDWTRRYLEQGSSEWGAGLYENVNLLSLCNLFDFSSRRDIRSAAGDVLDRLARESALNAMAGATAGAARREYGCYRVDLEHSPSRALHALWFGSPLPGHPLDFIGGVLVAALSAYRPSTETIRLAHCPGPLLSSNWITRPFYQPDVNIPESFRVTTRQPGVQLSGTVIPASPSRYTDITWTAVLDPQAVVFANHPFPASPSHAGAENIAFDTLLRRYEAGDVEPDRHPAWVPGNMPPGMPGDLRPGFWQGHGTAPACWMRDRTLLCLWPIPDGHPVPWIHLHLPVHAFDRVEQKGAWIFARKGPGRLRIWTSSPARTVNTGVWKDIEWRVDGPAVGLAVQIDSGADWREWTQPSLTPRWDAAKPALTISIGEENVVLTPAARFPDRLLPPRIASTVLNTACG